MSSAHEEHRTIYQHPLAYLIGRGHRPAPGVRGRVRPRVHACGSARSERCSTHRTRSAPDRGRPDLDAEGYDSWAPVYDHQSNQLLEIEQPIVREILDALPVGVALDAACGTGRHAEYLASLGHTVIGVDSSPGMLAHARDKVPAGEFHEADLHALPLDERSVDVVVCAIALSSLPDIRGPFGGSRACFVPAATSSSPTCVA